jgi:transposase
MEDRRNALTLLVGKPEEERPLGRPRRRWVNNVEMDFGERGRGDVNWIDVARDRDQWRALAKAAKNLLDS